MAESRATQKDPRNLTWLWAIRIALILLGVLGLGLLSLSLLALAGQLGTPIGPVRQHLSASELASSAVAGATLMLAVFTAYLALELARASRQPAARRRLLNAH